MATPADIFHGFTDDFLRSVATDVMSQEASVLSQDLPARREAVRILRERAGIADERTAERQVVNCTRNEVIRRWLGVGPKSTPQIDQGHA